MVDDTEPKTETETGTDSDMPPDSRRNWLCIGLASVLVCLLLGIGANWTWSWYQDRSYVGSSERVTLDWDCTNGISWTGPAGHRWWAGHDPVPTGTLDTAPTTPGTPDYHHATGTLHYDSRMTATFTSDAGGTLTFTRQPSRAFYTADCKIGF
ncbi:MAG: hypothetical protein ACXV8G_04485 [Acidimicrobiales bacterium]